MLVYCQIVNHEIEMKVFRFKEAIVYKKSAYFLIS